MANFKRAFTAAASTARTATGNSGTIDVPGDCKGFHVILNISAASGSSPTLDITVERFDVLSATWVALPGGAFAQKTTTGSDDLTIYPGIAETNNRSVSDVIGEQIRFVWTIGGTTPSFTFTLGGTWII